MFIFIKTWEDSLRIIHVPNSFSPKKIHLAIARACESSSDEEYLCEQRPRETLRILSCAQIARAVVEYAVTHQKIFWTEEKETRIELEEGNSLYEEKIKKIPHFFIELIPETAKKKEWCRYQDIV